MRSNSAGVITGRNRFKTKQILDRAIRAEELERRWLLSTSVTTYHNDNFSTGVNSTETQLTLGNVNTTTFGKQFSTVVDGQVYAQPLYVPATNIVGGPQPGVHDVAYVATQHDTVYAIDTSGGNILWQTSLTNTANAKVNLLGATAIAPMPAGDTGSGDISVEVGITSTPVINASTGLMYVSAKSKQTIGGNASHFVYTLYAIDIHSGAISSSIVMGDTINNGNGSYTYRQTADPYTVGTGDGVINVSGQNRVYFNAMREMNRPGLTIANGSLYIAFASHGDNGPYHGWILKYDPSSLALTGALNLTPNGGLGGIWQGGGILAVDPQGYLYCETGNGSFNTAASNFNAAGMPIDGNYGDCFVKIGPDTVHNSITNQNINGWGMQVTDFFSPFNNAALNSADTDLGSGGPVVLPDAVGNATHPHLLVGSGKEGKIYLIDRDSMGKFNASTDKVVQTQGYGTTTGIHGSLNTPAFFNNTLYYWPGYGGDGRSFSVSNASFSSNYVAHTTDTIGQLDGTPSISANGTSNAIAWIIDRGSNQLRAYNATDLTTLWTSAQAAAGRDQLGSVVKFTVPTVADGRALVGTSNALVVYGPPIPPTTAPTAPGGLAATAQNYATVNLSWQDLSNNEALFKVERSTNGTNWTQIGTSSANLNTDSDTTTLATTHYYYRVRANNAVGDSGYSNVAEVTTPAAPSVGTGDGLSGAYFNDPSPSFPHLQGTPVLTRVDTTVNNAYGNGGPGTPVGTDHFSVRWTGKVQPQASETYTFYTTSDDGVRLYVNNQLIINNFVDHSPTENSGTIALSAGQKYDIRMEYYENGGGATATLSWSSPSTAKAIIPKSQLYSGVAPTAPSSLSATPASGTQINLAWNDNSTIEEGFSIERKTGSGGTYAVVATVTPNTKTYMDGSLDPNTTYFYRVRATNFAANSAYSNVVSATTPVPPITPTNGRTTSVTTTQIVIAWDDNSTTETGFRVLRRTGPSTYIEIALLPPNTTSYIDNGPNGNGLTPGTDYDYHIQCYNVAGYSDFTGATTATLTLAPSALSTQPGGSGQINLSWTAPAYSGEASDLTFNIYRGTAAGQEAPTPIATNVSANTYNDSGLTNGVAYYYKVKAVDPGGASAFSNESHTTATVTAATIAGRYVFYNTSKFDGLDPAGNDADDAAVATDKQALVSGTASFSNYTSYTHGINGIMIDIAGLPVGAALTSSDFTFRTGNDQTPATWASVQSLPSITVRPGKGTGGSARVTLIWDDAGSVRNAWLQVTVKPTANTGIASADVFYFGNLVGDTPAAAGAPTVDSADYYSTRDHLRDYTNPVPATWAWDFNRDGVTDIYDIMATRQNSGTSLVLLNVTAPAPLAATVTKAPVAARPSRYSRPLSWGTVRIR